MYLASGQNIQKTAGVLYIGNSEAVKNTVKWWCTYSKREFQTADSFDGIVSEDSRLTDILVLDGTCLNTRDNIKAVSDAAEKGVNVIVSGLPDAEEIEKNDRLRKLLGIRYVEPVSYTHLDVYKRQALRYNFRVRLTGREHRLGTALQPSFLPGFSCH